MKFAELQAIYDTPFFDLLSRARAAYLEHWGWKNEVQLCTLLSIKTGGCSEDCGYCSQSARFKTPVRDLWLCGSSTHPGGGIMGANGRIAAMELLRSKRKRP